MLGFDDEALKSPTLKSGSDEPNDSLIVNRGKN
jgi:hypothetical protein